MYQIFISKHETIRYCWYLAINRRDINRDAETGKHLKGPTNLQIFYNHLQIIKLIFTLSTYYTERGSYLNSVIKYKISRKMLASFINPIKALDSVIRLECKKRELVGEIIMETVLNSLTKSF